ncbi:MAG: hypothetical protein N2V75_07170 [Methanophagales archaeon]|nr:hypothetical protein [Methanophagales archaeon]
MNVTFIPTSMGMINAAVISFIILFILFSGITDIRIKRGKKEARFLIAVVSLLYFCLWLIALSVGERVFHLELAPYLLRISVFCILTPYLFTLFAYLSGILRFLTWCFPFKGRMKNKRGD